MQQSLALLQAPTLELKALVEAEMQQNPVLEEAPTPEADQAERTKSEDGETAESADPSGATRGRRLSIHEAEKHSKEPADDFMAEFEKLAATGPGMARSFC